MEVFDYETKFSQAEYDRRMAELRYQFFIERCDNFPRESIMDVKTELLPLSDKELEELICTDFKKVNKALLLSGLLGMFGADRFYLGDKVGGLIKLLTLGGCGIFWIIDFFRIANITKEKNLSDFRKQVAKMMRRDKDLATD